LQAACAKARTTGWRSVAAEELLPGMTLAIFDITPIPLYNEDVRQAGVALSAGPPR
jgi:hypothetical protein